jgi:hypothetical protein
LAAGAERIAVYKLWDQSLPAGAESFGLLNPQTQEPRPGFYAWQTVIRYFNGAAAASLAQTEQANAVRLTMINDQYVYVLWARTGAPVQFEIGATSDKAYLISQTGEASLVDAQGGVYLIEAPGANCEQAEGCVVGGDVWLLVQPAGQSTVTQIVDGTRTALSF